MKILQINCVAGIRSTGRICSDIADILRENGHECKIAYGRLNTPEKYREISFKTESTLGVLFHIFGSLILDNAGFASKRATKKLIKQIEEYNPDLIHLHNIHGYYLNIEMLFAYLKRANKPIVWTLHDCWSFTGHCAYFDSVSCEKWKTQCENCPAKREYPPSFVLDRSAWNYAKKKQLFTPIENMTLVTPSKWLADLVKESFLKDKPVEVIPNGIDLTQFKPTEGDFRERYGLEGKKIVLGVASIWEKRKGLADFYRLAELLDGEYQIVLVGLSKQQIKKLPANVIGITRTNSVRELAEIYTAADVFVNPSVQETQGLTTVEALACGTPVVVYDKTAVPEAVQGSDAGIIVKAGDVGAIVNAIKMMNIGQEACLNRAKSYEKHESFSQYLRLYESMLK